MTDEVVSTVSLDHLAHCGKVRMSLSNPTRQVDLTFEEMSTLMDGLAMAQGNGGDAAVRLIDNAGVAFDLVVKHEATQRWLFFMESFLEGQSPGGEDVVQ